MATLSGSPTPVPDPRPIGDPERTKEGRLKSLALANEARKRKALEKTTITMTTLPQPTPTLPPQNVPPSNRSIRNDYPRGRRYYDESSSSDEQEPPPKRAKRTKPTPIQQAPSEPSLGSRVLSGVGGLAVTGLAIAASTLIPIVVRALCTPDKDAYFVSDPKAGATGEAASTGPIYRGQSIFKTV